MQRYWQGTKINQMTGNNIFVFGSNPEGRHGLGAAKCAMQFGARYGIGRGLQGNTYALPTKNLKAGFIEVIDKAAGKYIKYTQAGKRSISKEQITANIKELYTLAVNRPELTFFTVYQNNSNNLNGYSPNEIVAMFRSMEIPSNILLHNSFKT